MKTHQPTGRLRLTGAALTLAFLAPLTASCAALDLSYADQGGKWTAAARDNFYTQDQGSRMIPLPWLKALKQADGKPFLDESLGRYGYLPNPKSPEPGLPVGFVSAAYKNTPYVGMTCAACHTREIHVGDKTYRIDGGPAIVDFQNFMNDLDIAVDKLLADPTAFAEFAKQVLGPNAKKADEDTLRAGVDTWFKPYHAIVKGSLPVESPWGPSRLDAVSMIFNRVTGLDIGPKENNYIIAENIKRADVPTRYPFVWNASIQDTIQWPGFAPNGNRLFALSRNLGEVIGVFGDVHPQKDSRRLLKIDYVGINSANFHGLNKLESLIKKIGPPKWPGKLDAKLVAEGEKVWNKKDPNEDNESCADCHAIKKGKFRSLLHETWATPLKDVGTDSREVNLLSSQVKTGVLEGATIFPDKAPLKAVDSAFSVLGTVVGGAILQHYLGVELSAKEAKEANKIDRWLSKFKAETSKLAEELDDFGSLNDLKQTFPLEATDAKPAATPSYPYESRVLEGIWAAAPYLHNGSVASLAELLTPADKRLAEFKVGPEYDLDKVGLAATQTKFNFTYKTTGCDDRNSGNSRCGHDYGTTFPDQEKKALLEFMKAL